MRFGKNIRKLVVNNNLLASKNMDIINHRAIIETAVEIGFFFTFGKYMMAVTAEIALKFFDKIFKKKKKNLT